MKFPQTREIIFMVFLIFIFQYFGNWQKFDQIVRTSSTTAQKNTSHAQDQNRRTWCCAVICGEEQTTRNTRTGIVVPSMSHAYLFICFPPFFPFFLRRFSSPSSLRLVSPPLILFLFRLQHWYPTVVLIRCSFVCPFSTLPSSISPRSSYPLFFSVFCFSPSPLPPSPALFFFFFHPLFFIPASSVAPSHSSPPRSKSWQKSLAWKVKRSCKTFSSASKRLLQHLDRVNSRLSRRRALQQAVRKTKGLMMIQRDRASGDTILKIPAIFTVKVTWNALWASRKPLEFHKSKKKYFILFPGLHSPGLSPLAESQVGETSPPHAGEGGNKTAFFLFSVWVILLSFSFVDLAPLARLH